jgi:hypothetical protein
MVQPSSLQHCWLTEGCSGPGREDKERLVMELDDLAAPVNTFARLI